MATLSDTQVIALAVNSLIASNQKRSLTNIVVDRVKKLSVSQTPGWKVFFIFAEQNSFLQKTIVFEVDDFGTVSLLERM